MTPPRLDVLTAAGCGMAVILRRGPADHTATIGWDRDRDRFIQGQWLKGRIYEHRSDLSPDGTQLVVFAGNGHSWWTAVSRAPYLRAVWFARQSSTWHGGGAFTPDGRLWLNGGAGPPDEDRGWVRLAPDTAFPHATDGFHMGDLVAARMTLRGWVAAGSGYDLVLHKPAAHGMHLEWRFQIGAQNRGIISNRFALTNGAEVQEMRGWEWADVRDGHLEFAEAGCLWRANLRPDGSIAQASCLYDTSQLTYDPQAAPYS